MQSGGVWVFLLFLLVILVTRPLPIQMLKCQFGDRIVWRSQVERELDYYTSLPINSRIHPLVSSSSARGSSFWSGQEAVVQLRSTVLDSITQQKKFNNVFLFEKPK